VNCTAVNTRAGLAPLGTTSGFAFDWVENAAGWTPACLHDNPVVLLSKSNVCSATDRTPWLAGAAEHALARAVSSDGDLAMALSRCGRSLSL
jgi:hypothetical protein